MVPVFLALRHRLADREDLSILGDRPYQRHHEVLLALVVPAHHFCPPLLSVPCHHFDQQAQASPANLEDLVLPDVHQHLAHHARQVIHFDPSDQLFQSFHEALVDQSYQEDQRHQCFLEYLVHPVVHDRPIDLLVLPVHLGLADLVLLHDHALLVHQPVQLVLLHLVYHVCLLHLETLEDLFLQHCHFRPLPQNLL